MRNIALCLVIALCAAPTMAEDAPPFGYVYGPFGGTAYLFHMKCPAENAEAWAYSKIVIDNGEIYDVGHACWKKFKASDQKTYPGYSLRICDLGSARWGLPKHDFKVDHLRCDDVDTDKVLKFIPKEKAQF